MTKIAQKASRCHTAQDGAVENRKKTAGTSAPFTLTQKENDGKPIKLGGKPKTYQNPVKYPKPH